MCVCVTERERGRQRERGADRDRDRQRQKQKEREERDRKWCGVCARVCVNMHVYKVCSTGSTHSASPQGTLVTDTLLARPAVHRQLLLVL